MVNHTVLASEEDTTGRKVRVVRSIEICEKQKGETENNHIQCIICQSNEIYSESLAQCEIMKKINTYGNCDISRVVNDKVFLPNAIYSIIFLN